MRNNFIDLIKLIACFAIIILHTKGIGIGQEYVLALTRWAVPFFFAFTGTHLFHNDYTASNIRKSAVKTIIKYFKILIGVNLIYWLYSLIWYINDGYSFVEWFKLKFNLWYILNWTLVEDNSNDILHLWYVVAIIKSSIVFFILSPIFKKIYNVLTIVMLFFLYRLNYSFVGDLLQTQYINWICIGLTYILVGIVLSDYIDSKKKTLNEEEKVLWQHKLYKISIIGLILGIVITLIEAYYFYIKEIYILVLC